MKILSFIIVSAETEYFSTGSWYVKEYDSFQSIVGFKYPAPPFPAPPFNDNMKCQEHKQCK